MNEARRIEKLTWIFGLLLSAGSLAYGSLMISAAVFLGALFATINLRLLIWSWSSVFQTAAANSQASNAASAAAPAEPVSAFGVLPRFVLKYTFLLLGMVLLLFGLRSHPIGFGIGVSNVFLAILLYPLMPQKTE